MESLREKKPEEYNGIYNLKDGNKVAVQWYPGVGSFYFIVNNDSGQQGSCTLNRLKRLLKDNGLE